MDLVILDLGYGNKRSLSNSLERNGIPFRWESRPNLESQEQIAGYVIPGVGSAALALLNMRETGWHQFLQSTVQPVIGICLGFQLLFESVEEDGTAPGLALLEGAVRRLRASATRPIPNLGWNQVQPCSAESWINSSDQFYFAHSFGVSESRDAVARTDDFVSMAARGRVRGFQFHPELSALVGDQLLRRTYQWCKSYPR
jgi:glutamine amidotransferase